MNYKRSKSGRLIVPKHEGVRGYRPEDLKRYERYQKRWKPSLAYALISNIAAGSSDAGASVTTAGIDTTGATLLGLILGSYGLVGLPTISDSKSNTWNQRTRYNSNNYSSVTLYWSVPSSVGSSHTFTASGAGTFPSIAVTAWSGGHASAPYDVENGATGVGVSTLATGSITPSENNCLVIAGLCLGQAETETIDSGMTISDSINFASGQHFGVAQAYIVQTTAAAINPTWGALNGQTVAADIASFKAAAAGRATKNTRAFTLGTEIGMNWRSGL